MKSECFKLVQRDNMVKKPYVADKWDLLGKERLSFELGRKISDWPEGVFFAASTPEMDGDLDDFVVNNAMVPLVSERFVEMLKGLSVPAYQILPVEIMWFSGKKATGYILNFTELIEALDLERTEVSCYPPDFSRVELRNTINLALNTTLVASKITGLDLFRCKEFRSLVVASDNFKRQFKAQKMTGVSFSPVKLS